MISNKTLLPIEIDGHKVIESRWESARVFPSLALLRDASADSSYLVVFTFPVGTDFMSHWPDCPSIDVFQTTGSLAKRLESDTNAQSFSVPITVGVRSTLDIDGIHSKVMRLPNRETSVLAPDGVIERSDVATFVIQIPFASEAQRTTAFGALRKIVSNFGSEFDEFRQSTRRSARESLRA